MNVRRYIPRVNPLSEYIFGTSVIKAALKSKKRKLYRLYVYSGQNRTQENRERDQQIKAMARELHPDLEIIDEHDIGNLDSLSDSRPHNGYVLEAEKIYKIPLISLGEVTLDRSQFRVTIAQHTDNPEIKLRDQPNYIKCRNQGRYPFVLMLDEILDPGNLGAMIRSAYYLGADALVVSGRNSAPLSPVCLKAASGATEWLHIFEFVNASRFLEQSKGNGWTFYAAVLPPPGSPAQTRFRYIDESQIGNALDEGPCCLILGQEGEGLRPWMAAQANYRVGISRGNNTSETVDSLNVSVAAAILCNRFLNPARAAASGRNPESRLF
ncbi:Alpha/beta knot methyltransferase [Kalaharituber pfeilii]|nr:Alpha/beta knot methyltransferase [Kalaharituber pfeilii]